MPNISNNRILPRERVTAALSEAARRPLTVLTAPLGYGKTTAAREFAAMGGRPAYFAAVPPSLSKDGRGQDNPRYLWQQICGQLAGQGLAIAADLAGLGFPEDPFQMDRVLSICRDHPGAVLLVLDDYHNIQSPEFDAYMENLIRARLPDFSVLLLSRERPNLPLEEMALKGLAVHLGQNLLAFSEEETRELFRLHQSRDLEAASRAHQLCEGWAAAIWLSLQSWLAHGFIEPSRDMELLLERTVFPAYSREEQRLLLALSFLENFTPHQAGAISGEAEAPRLLRQLRAKNALITYAPATDSYQFHSIFQKFLAGRLAELPDASFGLDKPLLRRRAGEWFALYGDPLRAIHFFAQAGRDEDYLRILEIFARPGDGLLVLLDPEGLPPIMESIPWRVRLKCPIGFLAFVFHYLSMVDPRKALPLLEEAVRRFSAADFPPETRRRLEGEVELIYSSHVFNEVKAMFRHHARAAELLGDTPSALHLPRHVWAFGSPHVAYQYLREPGGYEELTELARDGFQLYQKVSGGCGAGLPELVGGEWRLERGELEAVEPLLYKALFKAMNKNQATGLVAATFTLARLRLAQGRRNEALELMRDVRPAVEAARNTLLDTLLHISRGYVGAVAGEAALMEIWLSHGPETVAGTLRQGQTFAAMVYSGALMFFRRWPELAALGETLEEDLGRFRNLFGYIHSRLMRAVAAWRLEGRRAALTHFQKALELAGPDGIILTIAEYGPYILPVAEAWEAAGGAHPKLMELTRAMAAQAEEGKGRGPLTPRMQAFLSAFGCTAREQEVFELIINGLSAPAISQTLGISESTVRYHQTGLFRKTGQMTRRRLMDFFRAWKP